MLAGDRLAPDDGVEEGARERPARGAGTIGFDRGKVVRELTVFQLERSGRSEGDAESGGSNIEEFK